MGSKNRPTISVITQISNSTVYAKFWYENLQDNTTHALNTDDSPIEAFFLVNNPPKSTQRYMRRKEYPHFLLETEEQPPYPDNIEYICSGWNIAGMSANGSYLVFMRPDMVLSGGWDEALLDRIDLLDDGHFLVPSTVFQSESDSEHDAPPLPIVCSKKYFAACGGFEEHPESLEEGMSSLLNNAKDAGYKIMMSNIFSAFYLRSTDNTLELL